MDLAPPRGTEDLLPPRSEALLDLADAAHRVARLFGFRYLETPAFESTDLFSRTSGESSDVVRKEMYTFSDRSGRSLTLRPEGTAPVVRALLKAGDALSAPFKGYYVGPMWRYGRPQTGRLREFRQFGVETVGAAGPAADVEVIAAGDAFFRAAGPRDLVLELNSIGDEACRPAYRAMLIDYLEAQSPRLRDEHRDRFRENPLRVLDCKEETCRDVAEDAPKIADHLCGPCKEHFEQVRSLLESGGVAFALVPTLVRGLDYYTRTAFEWTSPSLPPGQASLGGGGRYDGLAEVLGGPPTPGVGFALGLERILLTVPQPAGLGATRGPVCFVIGVGEGQERALELVRLLRAAGVPAEAALEVRPLKAQLRMADRSGARFAVLLGERELEEGTVTVRRMHDGRQQSVPATDLAAWISGQA